MAQNPDFRAEFQQIFDSLNNIETTIKQYDKFLAEELKTIKASFSQLRESMVRGLEPDKEPVEEEEPVEKKRAAGAVPKARTPKSSTGKSVMDWEKATAEQRGVLGLILQELQPLREKIHSAHGTPEYESLLSELHRTVNRRCFEENLPPYILEGGRYPGYGDHDEP